MLSLRVIVVTVEDSVLTEFVYEYLKSNLNQECLNGVELYNVEKFREAFPRLVNEIDGYPAFLFLDKEDNIVKCFIGGDKETLSNFISDLRHALQC